jgi:hypothetical protein
MFAFPPRIGKKHKGTVDAAFWKQGRQGSAAVFKADA